MRYTSTRAALDLSCAQAVVKGISQEGGLFVPVSFPAFSLDEIGELVSLPYYKRAAKILSKYTTDFTYEKVEEMCSKAYGKDRFPGGDAAPVVALKDSYVLELFRGPTSAFKDMALQMLPHLMTNSMRAGGVTDEVVILVATSGDTGKAALEGFADVPGTRVIVFYPYGGVSKAQRLQMVTQKGENVDVCAVRGNFDDAQTGVKNIFADEEFAAVLKANGKQLSSANSINFGRLVPQIAYYFSAYADMVKLGAIKLGDKINVCVPTGNFGNILAADYAQRMGLPVNKFICASNKNNVLTDFINTGVYDRNRDFYKTTSPSMDILISSNVERLIYQLCGHDNKEVSALMDSLKESGKYALPEKAANELKERYYGSWADDDMAAEEIGRVYKEEGYVMDPHTAVASAVYQKYREKTCDTTKTIVVSTASPYKFSGTVLKAISGREFDDEFEACDELERMTGVLMPEKLKELRTLPERHLSICDKEDMEKKVYEFLHVK